MTRARFLVLGRSALLVVLAALGAPLQAQIPTSSAGPATVEGPSVTLTPQRPEIGSFVRLTIRRANRPGDSLTAVIGWMAGDPLHFQLDTDGNVRALAAIPLEASDSVVARIALHFASGAVDSLHNLIPYAHRPAPAGGKAAARRLRVSRVYTARPDALTEARIERENELARAVGRRAHDTPILWTEPFQRPRDSRITSVFGSGRLFNGRLSSSHGGVDFSGQPRDPVRAANRGIVALVENFFLAGNVVYIDHGGGVVTGYFHLTEATVAVGDTVERGQQIGLVGATGRVTGPHLHWQAQYGSVAFDPTDLLALRSPQ
jgi:murein DD-endopeptidase MepM/ murein hydrolase activator NlpD